MRERGDNSVFCDSEQTEDPVFLAHVTGDRVSIRKVVLRAPLCGVSFQHLCVIRIIISIHAVAHTYKDNAPHEVGMRGDARNVDAESEINMAFYHFVKRRSRDLR